MAKEACKAMKLLLRVPKMNYLTSVDCTAKTLKGGIG
jgi:hypothetical protein